MTRADIIPEGRGYELIDGILLKMAAQYDPHVKIVALLLRYFARVLPETLLATTPSTFLSEKVVLETDLAIYPIDMKSTDVRGPDFALVIEVSDTTIRSDLGKKAKIYAAHGGEHYWELDVTANALHRHSGPGDNGHARTLRAVSMSRSPCHAAMAIRSGSPISDDHIFG